MPVRVLGVPFGARNTIVSYEMYLETMRFPKNLGDERRFESVWPFLLFLLNNWIRHQMHVMQLDDGHIVKEDEVEKLSVGYRTFAYDLGNRVTSKIDQKELRRESEEFYVRALDLSSEIEFDDRFDVKTEPTAPPVLADKRYSAFFGEGRREKRPSPRRALAAAAEIKENYKKRLTQRREKSPESDDFNQED